MFRPAWRGEVVFHPQLEDAAAFVRDAMLDRRIELGDTAPRIAERLDGTRTVEELAKGLAAEGIPPARVESIVRTFLMLGFLEGSGDETRARVGRLLRGEEKAPHSVLDEARFECQGSGQCCQNYHLGPLADADLARLDALDLATAFPDAGGAPWFDVHEWTGGGSARYLRTKNNRCIFLLEDMRCGLHATFGAEAKPGFCRTYPIEHLATIDGIKLYDKGSCATFAVSARRGLPMLEDARRLFERLPAKHQLYHPIVHLDPETACDYGYWLALERSLLALVTRSTADATTTLRALGRASRDYTRALSSCPLAAGEPDATVEAQCRAIAATPGSLFSPPIDPVTTARDGAAALAGLTGELFEATSGMIASRRKESQNPLSARLQREAAQLIHLIHSVASHAADPSFELSDWYAEVAARPILRDGADEVLRISMRQQLFGFQALVDERLAAGLLRIALIQLLAVYGAKLRAAIEGRPRAEAEDLSFGHMLAVRTLDLGGARAALLAYETDVFTILEGLPSLVTWS